MLQSSWFVILRARIACSPSFGCVAKVGTRKADGDSPANRGGARCLFLQQNRSRATKHSGKSPDFSQTLKQCVAPVALLQGKIVDNLVARVTYPLLNASDLTTTFPLLSLSRVMDVHSRSIHGVIQLCLVAASFAHGHMMRLA